MDELVSAKTIAALTVQAATGPLRRRPPTPHELKQHTTFSLHTRNEQRRKKIDGKDLPDALKDFEHAAADKKHARALANQTLMEKLITHPPDGFEFVPIAFTRISREQNQEVLREFSSKVRPHFMKFLAEEHAGDLRRMGICDNGIERMKNGFDPADERGRVYDLSVDHIIERAGSGRMGTEKAVDPLMPPGSPPTYRVNHFSNLILLPQKLHDLKNTINSLQSVSERPVGSSTWCYMLVPDDRSPENPRFVHVPAPQSPNPFSVLFRETKPEDLIGHASYLIDRLVDELPPFLATPEVKTAIEATNDIFASPLPLSASRLFGADFTSRVFESVINGGGPLVETYRKRIKPLFDDLAETLKLFEKRAASGPAMERRTVLDFVSLFEGKRMKSVMVRLDEFPPGVLDQPRRALNDLQDRARRRKADLGVEGPARRPRSGSGPAP